jgi:hypothetical protein
MISRTPPSPRAASVTAPGAAGVDSPPCSLRQAARVGVGLAALLAVRPASAAPDENAPPKVHVLHLAADDRDDRKALPLTKALEGTLLRRANVQFVNTNKALLSVLREARCGQGLADAALDAARSLDASSGRSIDAACQARVAAAVGAPLGPAQAFAWGWLYRDGPELRVELRLWQRGRPERKASLAVDDAAFDRTAERLWRHVFEGDAVGDVRVLTSDAVRGELYVAGEHQGYFSGSADLTLSRGPVTIELFDRGRQVARGTIEVFPGQAHTLTLQPARPDEAPRVLAPVASAAPVVETVRAERTAWPWAVLGVGGLGLVGAGALHLARQGARDDLESTCASVCPPRARDDIDRANTYGTLSAISLGVGVVGLGLGAFLLWKEDDARRAHPASGTIVGAPNAGVRRGGPFVGAPIAGVRRGGPFVGWEGAF